MSITEPVPMLTANACMRFSEAKSICQLLASTEEQSARSLPVWGCYKGSGDSTMLWPPRQRSSASGRIEDN